MTAIFSLELSQEPQYVDLLDVAAGYGSLSVPVTDLLPGDSVTAMYLTIQGSGLSTISAVIDQIQRAQGFYEWTDSESVDGHFTLTSAQTAAIAAATSCTYNVQVQITRSGSSYIREVQAGNINARPAIPTGPLIVASVSVTGGPVVGAVNSTTQLAAVARDSFNAIVPGVAFAWTTADASIATVSATGLVTIHALGATTIYATASGVFGSTIATGTITPFAVGSIPYASSLSAISMLPIGTPNQYLRTNGAATAPEWDTLTAADIAAGVFQSGDFTFGGNVLFGTDNTFDIGGAGINRPRDLKLARNIVVGGTTSLGGIVYTWPGSQSANKVLKTDGAGTLSWSTPIEEIGITDLTDVTITGAANGQVLRFNSGTGLWENSTVGTQLTALNATELTSGTVPNARLAGAYTGITGLGTLGSDLLFTDATFDIGKVGATRPRDIFASRNVTIGGTIAVTGASTLGVVGAGATTVTTFHASSTSALDGDVTIGARLVFSALAGKIVPGATSISLRNSADAADNILILDSGAVTFRSTVGGITTLTATSIGGTLTTAAQPNVTSLGTLAANLLFVDASFDIGQSGITRPRHGYFSGNVTAGSTFIGTLANTLTIGTHLTGGSFNNSGNITIATDAVSTNTISTIVARDGSGNFSAGTITASLTGAASLNLLLTGGTLAGALLFTDNTFDIGASGLTRPRSAFFGTNVTVGGVFIGNLNKTLTFGAHLISGGASFNNSADVTITSDATSANTASTIVARDVSGNFSAGTITATLVGAAAAGSLSGATLAAGVTASSLTSFGTLTADLLFTDALYDIGKSGATRPRDIFASRNVVVGGTINVTGATTLGAIAGLGTISSDLLFTDATYDIGKSAATRPRDLFISRNFTAGGTAAITGAVTLSSTLSIGGNVVSDIVFTDATFDIGKSGATRPRDGFFSRNFVIGGTLGVTGNVTFSGTGNTIGTVTSGTWNGSVLGVAFGGTNLASYTIGDIVYASGATTISKLGIGTAGQSLVVNGGATAPSWHTLVTADISDIATATTGITKVGALAIGSIATGFGGASFGGNVITSADATYDLGASGANRFRDAFFSRNVTVGGTLTLGTLALTTLTVSGNSTLGGTTLSLGTNGTGLNNAATDVAVTSPVSTGSGTPAGIVYQAGRVGGSSSTPQTLANVLRMSADAFALGQNTTGNNLAATAFVISAPLSTGNATPATLTVQTGHVQASGTNQHTLDNLLIFGDRAITALSTSTFTLGGSSITTTTITGTNLAGTLTTAAQTNITSVGALAGGSITTGFGGASFGGNVIATTDATYDLGASGATRFRDAFFSRNLTIGGAVSGVTTLAGSGAISGFTTATFSGQIATGAPATLTEGQVVIRETAAKPYALQMENQDASRRWALLIDTNSAADGNFGIIDRTSGGVQFKIAPITGAWTFAAGGTITTGGLIVSAGTTAVQAFTATTGSITANLTAFLLTVSNTNANPFGVSVGYPSAAPNSTSNQFLTCGDSGTTRAELRSNGGLANFSTNNVNLSDETLKTGIRDLESQWDRHKRIRIVRGRFIDQTHDDDNYMGIAQNIESIYPELVDDFTMLAATEDAPAKTAKAIYETDLNWITRDVVQECQDRIEQLEQFRIRAIEKYPELAAA